MTTRVEVLMPENRAPKFIQQGDGRETLAEVLADYTDPETQAEIAEVVENHRKVLKP